MEKEATVKSLMQDIYDLTQAEEIKDLDTEELISMKDFQDMIYQKVDQVASLLGFTLKDRIDQ